MLDGKPTAIQSELEINLIEMEDYKFKINDTFEIYYKRTDTTQSVEVLEVLDEMLRVKYINLGPTDGYN